MVLSKTQQFSLVETKYLLPHNLGRLGASTAV
jgi:hypothetical protein